jgi:hypothetical protein
MSASTRQRSSNGLFKSSYCSFQLYSTRRIKWKITLKTTGTHMSIRITVDIRCKILFTHSFRTKKNRFVLCVINIYFNRIESYFVDECSVSICIDYRFSSSMSYRVRAGSMVVFNVHTFAYELTTILLLLTYFLSSTIQVSINNRTRCMCSRISY